MPRANWRFVGLASCILLFNGCALLHDLQPHRLRRLNRVPPPHLDPEFTRADKKVPATLASLRQPRLVIGRPDADRLLHAAAVFEF